MVSTWRFWSGKEINFSRSHPFQILPVVLVVLYVVIRFSNVLCFAIGLTYMFSGIWARAAYSWSRGGGAGRMSRSTLAWLIPIR